PDLAALLTLGARNRHLLSGAIAGRWPAAALRRLRHARRANTPKGSRRNVAAHYDLGNGFYRLWLDDGMTYSAALFEDMTEPLGVAQRRKYRRLARCLGLRPGDRMLEIGCGWGEFAEMAAAEFGCRVVGVTLSSEQADFARNRLARAGLTANAEIRMQDYRDIQGTFDKIVSVEMFEAVGERNWPVYFDLLKRRLRPGGRAVLQTITIADSLFDAYRRNPGFIQRYIFPGGMLPSHGAFAAAVSGAGLVVTDSLSFGPSYGETLRRWTRAFQENRPAIERLGFDRRFQRMWHYYLACSEAGFDCGQLDVHQFVLERG
ncbi:MAG: cyclopropane-fatty-acyl-phospholipid synthase family protein, partial [Alphaproteobacteria bacterium]|nr:cyclopropane-fatty-acyl-phospholipid synthase family protein [Alphaproteobacteria bacterium]